ncbi:unnamed protein product, partial [marine sediment metagenome]
NFYTDIQKHDFYKVSIAKIFTPYITNILHYFKNERRGKDKRPTY